MPELDYMLIADFAKADSSGLTNIIGAGVDTVYAPLVPTVQSLGIAVRLRFGTTEQVGEPHQVSVAFVSADGPRLFQASFTILTPLRPPGTPPHWPSGLGIAIQLPIPLPAYGDYAFELDIDDGAITKSIDFRVAELPAAPPAGPSGDAPV